MAEARFGLFVDRLEVLLSSPRFSAAAREQGLALLDTLARSGAVLLLSACRNEFYPQVVASPSLMAGKGNGAHFDLLPPSRQELLQMIRLPAAAAGLSWEFDPESALGLDELLCREAASNPDACPCCSICCRPCIYSAVTTTSCNWRYITAWVGWPGL